MAQSDRLRDELARLQATEAGLRRDLARFEADSTGARTAASRKRRDADRARSDTTRRAALSSAETHDKKVVAAEKKIADVKKKIAANSKSQADKIRSLGSTERQERRTVDREGDRRRRTEIAHAREVARLSTPTVRYVEVREPEPEKLRVLYLTANPEFEETTTTSADGTTTTVGTYLRLDAEVREVQRALRGARYRDRVAIDHRPAATTQDLLDAINDLRPHIIHFSGHGWTGGVVFDNGSVDTPEGQDVEFDLLAEALGATDTPPRLVVLNSCESLAGADALLPVVPVIIAMADSIDDTAAVVFARHFYAGIASAQSVGSALKQARVGMKFASLDDADTVLPQIVSRDDVDLETLVLVIPPETSANR